MRSKGATRGLIVFALSLMLAAFLNVPANVGNPLLIGLVAAESRGRSCPARRA